MANIRKKNGSLSLNEDELLSEKVRSYPCLYDRSSKSHKEKDVIKKCLDKDC